MAKGKMIVLAESHPRTLLLGLYTPDNKIHNMEGYFEEFLNLIKTAGLRYDETFFTKIRAVDASHFLMKGKREEIADFCEKHKIEEVVCSEILNPVQERNLSNLFECTVFDRTQLILEIFRRAAHTGEAKTQVEIANFEYLKTRLAGRGLELGQQEGRIGTRGPGETQKELLKRLYENKISQAKKQLKVLEQTRSTQRKQRLASNTPMVAIIGYTNSGKSSLLNILAHDNILAENKLFATVDTTTRTMFLDPKKKILLSDTVGFISQLPHHLIEAFKSTLDELRFADLLLHVVDISNPLWKNHITIAQDILTQLKIDKPIVYVFNKKDKVAAMEKKEIEEMCSPYRPHVLTDTLSREGVSELMNYLITHLF